ncbi:MAG: TrkH family potassium uptake protein [Candidatus Binatia bacterium]
MKQESNNQSTLGWRSLRSLSRVAAASSISRRLRHRFPPPALLAFALLLTICSGAALLRSSFTQTTPTLSWLDAIFTATSAACVTGLVVIDTGSHFTFFGQVVILLLIQLGGLGVMTIGTLVLFALGQRPTAVVRHLLSGLASHRPTIHARDILGTIIMTTFIVEFIGACLLFVSFVDTHDAAHAAWLAIFHSVSAFCNAGFSLWPDSLTRYAADPIVNVTITSLTVLGGLGFIVLVEVRLWAASRLRNGGAYEHLSLHSRVILTATLVAFLGGTLLLFILELGNVLVNRPWTEQLLIAAFQSASARTAGFNTIDIGALTNPSLLVLIGLMFIGAGPGSMAGGIKLTSAAVVLALVVQRMRGNREVSLFHRAIGDLTIQRAVVLAVLASLLVGATVCIIEVARSSGPPTLVGRGELLAVVFETVSAFGTVGLSMGLTPTLGAWSKLSLIGLMFIGRLGPLLLMDFFEHLPPAPPIRYAKEELMVG